MLGWGYCPERLCNKLLLLLCVDDGCEFAELIEREVVQGAGIGKGVGVVGDFIEGIEFAFVDFVVGGVAVDVVGGAVEGATEFLHYFKTDFVVLAGGDSVCEVGADAVFGEKFTAFFDVSCFEEGVYVVLEHGLWVLGE